MSNDRKIIILAIVLIALVAGGYYFIAKKNPQFLQKFTSSQIETVRAKAEKYINENLVAPGIEAKIKEISEENGLYKILVSVGDQEIPAYISKDGKNFFPQVFNMDEQPEAVSSETNENSGANVAPAKSDVPEVDLFVMSYCPYGLQMEKGILPVVDLLGSKIKFNLKFVDYAMHGDQEIQENLRQYCINQKYASKLSGYLQCFAKQGESDVCLTQGNISKATIDSCVSSTDEQYKITATAKDQTTWRSGQFPIFQIHQVDNATYGIAGSPTLIINGTQVSSARDPQSLLNLICSAFNSAPSVCNQELSVAVPSAGFGEGTGSSSDSSCGN